MSEWKFDQSEFLNNAAVKWRGQTVDLYFDKTGLEIIAESGSGYLSSREQFTIPTDVLIQMLRHAGYEVKDNPDGS